MERPARSLSKLLPAATALLACALPAFAANNVLVVDANGGGPFTSIQAAVDAAQDGDVLLVRSGTYPGFVVADKSVTVVGDVGAQVSVVGGSGVRDLAATRTVVLVDIDLSGATSADPAISTALALSGNAGRVRVERCVLVGGYGGSGGGRAVTISACADVALGACNLRGGYAPGYCAPDGREALQVFGGSSVVLQGCTLTGANGSHGGCDCDGGSGGDGAFVAHSTLFVSNSSFYGGHGGNCSPSSLFSAPAAGDGGDGIESFMGTIRILDSTTIVGNAGWEVGPGCGMYSLSGSPGLPRRGSAFTDLPGSAPTLSAPAIVNAGATESFTVRGTPGEIVSLFVSATTSATFQPNWNGMLLVPLRQAPLPVELLLAGVVPPSGALEFSHPMPALAPGAQARTTFIQGLLLDDQGRSRLTSARALVTLP